MSSEITSGADPLFREVRSIDDVIQIDNSILIVILHKIKAVLLIQFPLLLCMHPLNLEPD